jgi:2'-5' RNA ligase
VLRRRVDASAPRARLTWVAPERLHLTVRFIGEVDEARGAGITAALAPALDVPAFDLTAAGVGVFPRHGPPRVVWAPQGPFGVTRVGAITLFQSRLSPSGPTYVPLQRTALWQP